jgi:hypothetical protein
MQEQGLLAIRDACRAGIHAGKVAEGDEGQDRRHIVRFVPEHHRTLLVGLCFVWIERYYILSMITDTPDVWADRELNMG